MSVSKPMRLRRTSKAVIKPMLSCEKNIGEICVHRSDVACRPHIPLDSAEPQVERRPVEVPWRLSGFWLGGSGFVRFGLGRLAEGTFDSCGRPGVCYAHGDLVAGAVNAQATAQLVTGLKHEVLRQTNIYFGARRQKVPVAEEVHSEPPVRIYPELVIIKIILGAHGTRRGHQEKHNCQ
jgi:hypothetical protein